MQGGRGADRAAVEEEEAQREKEQQGGSPNTVAVRPEDETRGRILQYLIMSVGWQRLCLCVGGWREGWGGEGFKQTHVCFLSNSAVKK